MRCAIHRPRVEPAIRPAVVHASMLAALINDVVDEMCLLVAEVNATRYDLLVPACVAAYLEEYT